MKIWAWLAVIFLAVLGAAGLLLLGAEHDSHKTEVSPTLIYVSPDGTDKNDGSEENPLNTLQAAVDIARPGASILVLKGIYTEAVEVAGKSGLVIEGRGAVFDGKQTLERALRIKDSRNITVKGFTVKNYKSEGLAVLSSSGVKIQNNSVHNNGFESSYPYFGGEGGEGFGIKLDSSQYVIIENNEVYANGPNEARVSKGILGTGIDTYGNSHVTIKNNLVYENIGGGILVEDSENVTVENNTIEREELFVPASNPEDEWWDGAIWVDGGHDVNVLGNVLRDNHGPGLIISDEDLQKPYNYVARDNVFANNTFGLFIWNFGVCDFPPETVLVFSNNTIEDTKEKDILCIERA